MKLAWLTDVHLDFVEPPAVARLGREIAAARPDAVLLGGDISVARQLERHLAELAAAVACPLYFVLGNHDFYGSSFAAVRAGVAALCRRTHGLRWLVESGVVPLSSATALVGHDSWADGRLGDYAHSQVMLNDYLYIRDFAGLDRARRLDQLHALGDEAAAYFERLLPQAFERFASVVLLTHVPPFEGACWHEGRISDANYLPHFACGVVGDVLIEVMRARPHCHLTVLCGHTHGAGEAHILPNLFVRTGGADYGRPRLQEPIEVA